MSSGPPRGRNHFGISGISGSTSRSASVIVTGTGTGSADVGGVDIDTVEARLIHSGFGGASVGVKGELTCGDKGVVGVFAKCRGCVGGACVCTDADVGTGENGGGEGLRGVGDRGRVAPDEEEAGSVFVSVFCSPGARRGEGAGLAGISSSIGSRLTCDGLRAVSANESLGCRGPGDCLYLRGGERSRECAIPGSESTLERPRPRSEYDGERPLL